MLGNYSCFPPDFFTPNGFAARYEASWKKEIEAPKQWWVSSPPPYRLAPTSPSASSDFTMIVPQPCSYNIDPGSEKFTLQAGSIRTKTDGFGYGSPAVSKQWCTSSLLYPPVSSLFGSASAFPAIDYENNQNNRVVKILDDIRKDLKELGKDFKELQTKIWQNDRPDDEDYYTSQSKGFETSEILVAGETPTIDGVAVKIDCEPDKGGVYVSENVMKSEEETIIEEQNKRFETAQKLFDEMPQSPPNDYDYEDSQPGDNNEVCELVLSYEINDVEDDVQLESNKGDSEEPGDVWLDKNEVKYCREEDVVHIEDLLTAEIQFWTSLTKKLEENSMEGEENVEDHPYDLGTIKSVSDQIHARKEVAEKKLAALRYWYELEEAYNVELHSAEGEASLTAIINSHSQLVVVLHNLEKLVINETTWNMKAMARAKESLFAFMKEKIPGVTSSMVYIAMMFSWFDGHVKDHYLRNINYLGVGKTSLASTIAAALGKEYWENTKKWSSSFLEFYNKESDREIKAEKQLLYLTPIQLRSHDHLKVQKEKPTGTESVNVLHQTSHGNKVYSRQGNSVAEENDRYEREKKVLIFDPGGDTFDVSLLIEEDTFESKTTADHF